MCMQFVINCMHFLIFLFYNKSFDKFTRLKYYMLITKLEFKMKKIIKLLSLTFIFIIAGLLVGCGKHTHTLGNWQSDETHHWKACSDCSELVDKAEHQYSNGACLICEKEQPVVGSHGLTYSYTNYQQLSWTVTGLGTCEDAIITIPAEYQGRPVVAIGFEAFAAETGFVGGADPISKIIIPSSVTEIGRYAFKNRCSEIEFVNPTITDIGEYAFYSYMGTKNPIPSTVLSIGQYAYANNGRRTSITIPKSVTYIGISAFSLSLNLETAIFEDGTQIQELPQGLFNGCEKFQAFEVPASVMRLTTNDPYYVNDWNGSFKDVEGMITFEEGSQLGFIGKNYFQNFKGTIILPDGYTKIDNSAFYAASGAKIVVPATVTEIETKGLSAYEGNLNNCPAPSIFFKGTSTEWENITKGTTAVSESVIVYMSNQWQMINGVPTINE